MTARVTDSNGWYEVKKNPLSKVGVFPYLGKSIGAPEPDKIYNVYRPAEELNNQETIDSFKLIPWVDEHTMLGDTDSGLTPAEKKGVQGVIGENIVFEDGYLFGNIKVFSDAMGSLIESGKRELSCGYRCAYEFVKGVFDGQQYDAVQRNIRGNHLALVEEGRMGHEVAVLDHLVFTCDSGEFKMADEPVNTPAADADPMAELSAKLDALVAIVTKLVGAEKAEAPAPAPTADADPTPAADADTPKPDEAMDAKIAKAVAKALQGVQTGMDSKTVIAEINSRNTLAGQLSQHIGTFDHADMTLAEVAAYGVDKLGIKCAKGQEQSALTGYLHGRQVDTRTFGIGQDSANKGESAISKHLGAA